MNRKFRISEKTFGGYELNINLDYFDNKEDIIDYFIKKLRDKLIECKFNLLQEKLDKLMKIDNYFHIHDYQFGDLLLLDKNF